MDIQTISVVIAAVSVVIGVINSILSSRRAEKNDQQTLETRQAQLYMQIYNRWNSKDIVNAYGQARYAYTPPKDMNDYLMYNSDVNPEAYANLMMLGTFYEGLGVLVKKGLIDITLIEDLLSQRVIWHYETWALPFVDEIRKEANDPIMWNHFEYLYHEMKHRQRLTTRPEVK